MRHYSEEEIYDLLDAVNCIEDCFEIYDYVMLRPFEYSVECKMHLRSTFNLFIDINDKNFNT